MIKETVYVYLQQTDRGDSIEIVIGRESAWVDEGDSLFDGILEQVISENWESARTQDVHMVGRETRYKAVI